MLLIWEISGKVSAMKLSLPGQIATRGEYFVNNLLQSDYYHTESIDLDLGIFGEPI
jgi:hypothetical protein